MHVYGPANFQVHATQALQAPHGANSAQGATNTEATNLRIADTADEVQFSEVGAIISKAHDLPDIRADKVNSIRAALAEGSYDIESKLQLALGGLLDEIG